MSDVAARSSVSSKTSAPPSSVEGLLEVMQQAQKKPKLLIYNEIIANYTMKFSKNP
jgi:hypothetical protein